MKSKCVVLPLLIIFIGIIFLSSFSSIKATSETFPLVEQGSVSRVVYANQGDRIVGNFTIFNIPTWNDPYTGDPKTYGYAFKIAKVATPVDEVIYESNQQSHASFDVTCRRTGNYILRFNVGAGIGLGNAQATLNYQVVAPTPIPQEPTANPLASIGTNPQLISLITIVVIIVIGGISILLITKSKNRGVKTNSLPPPPP